MTTTHRLKTLSPYFEDLASGRKTFEVRENDRVYRVGDTLLLEHWSRQDKRTGGELGLVPGSRSLVRTVTYVYYGRGQGRVKVDLMPGYVVLGLESAEPAIFQGVQIGSNGTQTNTFNA